jgi:hypothetical protein
MSTLQIILTKLRDANNLLAKEEGHLVGADLNVTITNTDPSFVITGIRILHRETLPAFTEVVVDDRRRVESKTGWNDINLTNSEINEKQVF